MKVNIYNQSGKIVGETEVSDAVFGLKPNHSLLHQVVASMMANQRKPWAHTKDRGERRGGGRKPWRQKGTGRARVGSIRSPIWRKGGVVFGPRKEKDYQKKINKKMKRKALLMVLSSKLRDDEMRILDELKAEKTKEMAKVLDNLKVKSVLIGTDDKGVGRAARNIEKVRVLDPKALNVLDLLKYKYLVLTEKAVREIEKQFGPDSKSKK
jgi:large subunit ribosomal protein L4